jgi:short-chain Z-isoprenyl diphosphate synthase
VRSDPTDRLFVYRCYEWLLQRQLRGTTPPQHVAVILDGNRRWAKRQNGRPAEGHRAGAALISTFLEWCEEAGIEIVTLYLLSEDNLTGRSAEELHGLFAIITSLAEELAEDPRLVIRHVGACDGLTPDLQAALRTAQASTADHQGMVVNLAVGYGGRREIVDAIRAIAAEAEDEGETLHEFAADLSMDQIAGHLYTGGQPDPELIVRTSGEQRLSDFLLWQSAHSEFYFAEALWPDFRKIDFLRALRAYAQRRRRFGA